MGSRSNKNWADGKIIFLKQPHRWQNDNFCRKNRQLSEKILPFGNWIELWLEILTNFYYRSLFVDWTTNFKVAICPWLEHHLGPRSSRREPCGCVTKRGCHLVTCQKHSSRPKHDEPRVFDRRWKKSFDLKIEQSHYQNKYTYDQHILYDMIKCATFSLIKGLHFKIWTTFHNEQWKIICQLKRTHILKRQAMRRWKHPNTYSFCSKQVQIPN